MMNSLRYLLSFWIVCSGGWALAQPVKIIYDTDMESDVDDVGATVVLHALANRGEAEILATMVSSSNPASAPCLDAINTFYGRPDLPIGVPKGRAVNRKTVYAQTIVDNYPHSVASPDALPEAAHLYRRILVNQPDSSVVIVTVGYLTNLYRLLNTAPDSISPLSGIDLVRRKVKRYVCMGGRFPESSNPQVFGNWKPDPVAAKGVIDRWPTPILFSGGGDQLARLYQTGGTLTTKLPEDHLLRRAYREFFDRVSWTQGPTHHSADLLAVLIAVRGLENNFDQVCDGYNEMFENGTHAWRTTPDKEQCYVVPISSRIEGVTAELNQLMTTSVGKGPLDSLPSTGHADIDRVRRAVRKGPTNNTSVKERLNTLRLWVRLLSFSGADLNPLRDHYSQHDLHLPLATLQEKGDSLYALIDYEYAELEKILAAFNADPQQYLVDLNRFGNRDYDKTRDWPTLRGDEGQTGYTTQSGPMRGQLKWKFPAGHAWYATPAFADGKVFIGSPGVSYEAYCLDAATGKYIWKTQQKENQNQYRTPRQSSPTLVVDDQIVVREIGSGGNQRSAKHFVYIDQATGKETREVYAGHVDYRVGYAPFDGNDEYLVFPHSIQEIGSGGDRNTVQVVSFDSLVCVETRSGKRKWKHYSGEFYSEPLLANGRVYSGNFAGTFTCLDVATGEVRWTAETGSPINVRATPADSLIVVSNQAGQIMSFEAASGKLRWKTDLPTEERAFQLFSRATVHDRSVYVGSADRHLYCLDLSMGTQRWRIDLDNWVRSAPLRINDQVVVATVGGTVYGIKEQAGSPTITWQTEVADHGIYADLRAYREAVYVASSDFFLTRLNPQTGDIRWQTSVFESVTDEQGGRTLADLTGGGPDYQAGTTVADGIAYFGSPRFVYAVDVETGQEVWKFETRGQICGAPAVANGKVFFGQQGGTNQFYCVDARTGQLVWKKPLTWVWASPNVKDGKVYIASVKGTFYCCDQNTGEIIWQYESQQGAYPAPSFKDDLVYFGSWNGKYYAFDQATGALRWEADVEGHPDSGSTIVADSLFFAQGFASKYFYALAARNGKECWRLPLYEEWCNASPTSDGRYVLFSTYRSWLHQAPFPSHTYCADAATGKLVYKIPFAGGLTGAVICRDLVFTASTTDSYMRAWNLATGQIRWQYRMGGRAEETCTTIYGDKALMLATDGYLYAFE